MPIYEYKCSGCGHEFEDLVSFDKRDENKSCRICGSESTRKEASRFGISTTLDPKKDTIYSPKEIDKVVGSDADRKWQSYNDRYQKRLSERQRIRRKGQEPKVVDVPKNSDGTYSPVTVLGDKKERSLRKEYSEALQVHREERRKKGLKQFDGPGAIVE